MQLLPPSTHDLPGDLVLLAAERTVTVTREEHHQDVLAGRIGSAVAELRSCPITSGKHAGRDGLEVALDGRRVGELTWLMAQRYRPVVDGLVARGFRVGCEALLREDARGIQVELRLPGESATAPHRVHRSPTAGHTAPVPSASSRRPRPPVPTQRTHTAASPHVLPHPVDRRPPAPTTVLPYGVPHPPATRPRSRRLLGIVGAVVGVLVIASALGNGSRDEAPTSAVAPLPSPVVAPTAAAPATSTAPAVGPVDEAGTAPTTRATSRARAASPTTSKQEARAAAPSSAPAPRTVRAAPKPAPEPEPTSSDCHPSYSPCLPDGPDLDCADINGRVVVKGPDEYRLDADNDGIGCDSN